MSIAYDYSMFALNEFFFRLIFGLSGVNAFLDALIVFFAAYPYWPLLITGVFFWFLFKHSRGRLRLMLFLETSLALILSRGILTESIRFFFPHPRPEFVLGIQPLLEQFSSSFPSGHAAIFFVLAAVVLYWDKRWGTWLFVGALINGVARVAAGVHWPLDIVGGIMVGVLSAIVVHELVKPYREKLYPAPQKSQG